MGLGASPAPFKDGGRVTPVRPQLSGFVTPGTGERRGEVGGGRSWAVV